MLKKFVMQPNGQAREISAADPNLVSDLERAYGLELPAADPADTLAWLGMLIDAAITESHLGSDRRLAEILDVSPSTVTHWRKGRSYPGEDTMRRLADLAGEDIDEVMMLHDILTSKSVDARNARLTILRLIWSVKSAAEQAIPAVFLALFSIEQVLNKTALIADRVYIMKNSERARNSNRLAHQSRIFIEFIVSCAAQLMAEKWRPCTIPARFCLTRERYPSKC